MTLTNLQKILAVAHYVYKQKCLHKLSTFYVNDPSTPPYFQYESISIVVQFNIGF